MRAAADGVLLVDKPAGLTSFGVVDRLRRWLRIRKIGHTGTLDPFATGLLVLCLGRATRVAQYITSWDKEYEGVIRLGEQTDTDDPTGNIIFSASAAGIDRERIQEVMEGFKGTIQQVPPAFSAKKVNGVPSYRKARRGEPVALEARCVRIHTLELSFLDLPWVGFRARCAKGTYMRALARDLGRELGCGAHLFSLRRTAVGHLRVEQAVKLEELRAKRAEGLNGWIRSVDHVLSPWTKLSVGGRSAVKVRNGHRLFEDELPRLRELTLQQGDRVRLVEESGDFLAIGRVGRDTTGFWIHPEKVWSHRD